MSLVDEIRANTSNVRLAKLALAQAIANKGSSVGDYTNVPTFSNIIMGVNNIETGLKVNGTSDINILAKTAVNKGDVCVLEAPETTGYLADVKTPFPTTAKLIYTSAGTVYDAVPYTTYPSKVMAGGDFLVFFVLPYSGYSSGPYATFFYRINGVYEQLTINGSYKSEFSGYSDNRSKLWVNSFAFDVITQTLFVADAGDDYFYIYKLDIENKNLVLDAKITPPRNMYYSSNVWAHNNNVFYTYELSPSILRGWTTQFYYDPETKTITNAGEVARDLSLNTSSSNIHNCAFDYTYDALGNLYVYVVTQLKGASADSVLIRKMSLDASGIYQFVGKNLKLSDVKADKLTYYNTTTEDNPALNLNFGCSSLVYIDTSGNFRYLVIDTSTMTATEVDVPFSDGLDKSTITSIKLIKGTQFLYVKTSSADYTTAEQVRLYHYDIDYGGYVFVGCPATFFNPVTKEGAMPAGVPCELISTHDTPYQLPTNQMTLYDVRAEELAYNYLAQPCSNTLVDGDGYAIATESIAANEIGTGVLILS